MAGKDEISAAIRSAYAARLAEDIPGMLSHFEEDARFVINAEGFSARANMPVIGHAALEARFKALIDAYKIEDWEQIALLVDGDSAALHWRAKVTALKTGLSARFDVFDFLRFRGNKIVELYQSTDTAKLMTVAGL